MKSIRYFIAGVASGALITKTIDLVMTQNGTSCKKVIKNIEKDAKKQMNKLNSKVQNFEFEQWKNQMVNQLKTWLEKVENLTEDMIKNPSQIKDIFNQVKDDISCPCEIK